MSTRSIFTDAVHAGRRGGHHGAVSFPIYTASIFAFQDAEEADAVHNHRKAGYYYGRLGNPTQEVLEEVVAELEGAESALAFSSGMAAIAGAVLSVVKTGDHIVAPDSMYSTTTSFFDHLSEDLGVEISYVAASDPEEYLQASKSNTRLYWIETPSNPLLNITDIESVASLARDNRIATIADNTFATPFNQRPLELGVDAVIHSATKYLGGHSDLSAGILAGDHRLVEEARLKTTRLYGGNIAPQVAWLVLRGIKTFALRMDKHNKNASAIAYMLDSSEAVREVFYPGLPGHVGHSYAAAQMDGYGGIVSFDLSDAVRAKRFINSLRLCTIATSLGGVETIVQHSASMTHGNLTPEQRESAGISEGLIRLSVGIEDDNDLLNDLKNALQRLGG